MNALGPVQLKTAPGILLAVKIIVSPSQTGELELTTGGADWLGQLNVAAHPAAGELLLLVYQVKVSAVPVEVTVPGEFVPK